MLNEYQNRRKILLSKMDEGVAFIPSGSYKTRSNDTEYRFRQDSNFYYLSGFMESNALLVLIKLASGKSQEILFLQKNDDVAEMWNGKRVGLKAAKKILLLNKTFDIDTLEKVLPKLLMHHQNIYCDLFTKDEVMQKVHQIVQTTAQARNNTFLLRAQYQLPLYIERMRLIKSKHEITLIRKAVEITKKAHLAAMAAFKSKNNESEIHAVIDYIFASHGAVSDAYTSIVASGDNANTLHYVQNSDSLDKKDLVLIDAGCEYKMYASDITRVYPVDGRFSLAQKSLYNAVLYAQLKTIDAIKPGVTKSEIHQVCVDALTSEMLDLGILKGSFEEAISEKKYLKYFPHGTGHWMGIDVHDQNPYKEDNGDEIPFEEGMVMTIEPGLYISKDDMNIPKHYRGIGIRIEDDILVTADGYENLSIDIPKSIEEIERAMQVDLSNYL
jgi:Xaa-Pro aminopeptidase